MILLALKFMVEAVNSPCHKSPLSSDGESFCIFEIERLSASLRLEFLRQYLLNSIQNGLQFSVNLLCGCGARTTLQIDALDIFVLTKNALLLALAGRMHRYGGRPQQ